MPKNNKELKYNKSLTFVMDEKLYDWLNKKAAQLDVSRSQLIRASLIAWKGYMPSVN